MVAHSYELTSHLASVWCFHPSDSLSLHFNSIKRKLARERNGREREKNLFKDIKIQWNYAKRLRTRNLHPTKWRIIQKRKRCEGTQMNVSKNKRQNYVLLMNAKLFPSATKTLLQTKHALLSPNCKLHCIWPHFSSTRFVFVCVCVWRHNSSLYIFACFL